MARILIAGAGGHGREIFSWIANSTGYRQAHRIDQVAFLNDEKPDAKLPGALIGTIAGYLPEPDDAVICALGNPGDRRRVVNALRARGARMASFVHDDVLIGSNVSLGDGIVIFPRVTISCDVRIDDYVHLNLGASVTHDVTIGEYSTVGPLAVLLGGSSVGRASYIGSGAVVLPRQTVGDGCFVGAQALINREVASGTTVAGVPARQIGRNS